MQNERYCQCCAMPMPTDEMLGTEKDGVKNEDYCVYCYKDGNFTEDCTMDEMVEHCIPHTINAGVFPDAETARASMLEFFPNLKRWKK